MPGPKEPSGVGSVVGRLLVPGLLSVCDAARQQAEDIVERALAAHMFKNDPDGAAKANAAAAWFADFSRSFKSHGRRVSGDAARAQNIDVKDLEQDQTLQDMVLSVHHATLHTLSGTGTAKIIENHHGRAFVQGVQTVQIQLPVPRAGPAQNAARAARCSWSPPEAAPEAEQEDITPRVSRRRGEP